MTRKSEYELYLEQVNKLTERRQAVSTIYLTVNTAIVGAMALIFGDIQMQEWGRQLSSLALMVAGVAACDLWRRLIRQYSDLLGWWYERLRELEKGDLESTALITKEFEEFYGPKAGKKRFGMTRYEIGLTWLFTITYVVFGLAMLVILVLS